MEADYDLLKIDVCIEGTWKLLENTNWLGLMALKNAADHNPKLLSWVPDYEKESNLRLSKMLFKKGESDDLVFTATGTFVSTAALPTTDLVRSGSCLEIVARKIGVITGKIEL